jgi:hypothetical protein
MLYKIKFILFTIFFFIITSSVCFSQINETWRYYYPEFCDSSSNKLFFRLENNNFFKNTEYVNGVEKGYTLLGYTMQPSLMYYAGDNLRLKVGVHLLQYSGMDKFSEVLPVFSIHARLSEKVDLIMGGLKGDVHHQLIEPIFNSEHQYGRPIENGIQLLYNSNHLELDAWIDWEQFITHNDTKPEKFTAGISSKFRFTQTTSDWDLHIPAQVIITHLGGEISTYEDRVQSLANLVTGLKGSKKLENGYIEKIGLSAYLATYKDITKKSPYDFNSGLGLYPTAEFYSKHGVFMLGYWNAKNFIAPKGSNIFQSVSSFDEEYYSKNRQLITSKINFTKLFLNQFKFSLTMETYYDLRTKVMDYAYGINMVFTPNFFITKIKID